MCYERIVIQHQHPEICQKINLISPTQALTENTLANNNFTLNTAIRLKYDVPLAVLSSTEAYDLFT